MFKYKKCEICGLTFPYSTGKFTIHLKEHNIDLKDYIIKYELNGIVPKCQCGYCNEDAPFFRGKFLDRIGKHQKYKWLKEQYIKKYGIPKCITCDNEITKWNRGVPNKYCSQKCLPNNWNQEKINETIKEKYGVENVVFLYEVKQKISEEKKKLYLLNKEEIVNKLKDTCLIRYGEESYSKTDNFLTKSKKTYLKNIGVDHPSKTLEFRDNASKRMIENNSIFNFDNKYKIKKYKNIDLYYQSLYEYDFLEFCEKNKILDKIKNGNIYNFLLEEQNYGFRTITDFSMDDIEIEIKSSYVLEKQGGYKVINIKRQAVERNNKTYLLILDKNYNEFKKIIDNYGKKV